MPLLPLLFGIIGLYVIIRVVLPCRLFWPLRVVGAILIFVFAEKLYLTRLYYGSMSAYAMSAPVAVIAGLLNAFVIMLFLLALLRDLWRLCRFILNRKRPRPQASGQLGLTVAAAFLAIFSVWSALKIPDVNKVTLPVPDLPPALDGFRIVQLSDLHIGPIFKRCWLSEIVRKTNELQPDLVAITGDLVDGYPAVRGSDMMPLAELKARYGTYAVLGNHEYYSGAPLWIAFLRSIGLTVLTNDHVCLTVASRSENETAPLVIAGLTDPAARGRGLPAPDARKALQGTTGTRIMLAHNPALAQMSARAGADIQLSGHTHGGQLAFFAPVVARFNEGYVSGIHNRDKMQLYISRGTGLWSGMPLRLFCPSEITLLTLRQKYQEK